MWGHNWGQMLWGGGARGVPALSFWAVGVLCGALLVLGLRFLRAQRRALGVTALLLALAVPLTARATVALPFTFANNTIADATQVNANFNAVVNGIPNTYVVESFANMIVGEHLTLTAQCNAG